MCHPVDVTREFWDFVRDVASHPDVQGDDLKDLSSFSAISRIFSADSGDRPCSVKFSLRAGGGVCGSGGGVCGSGGGQDALPRPERGGPGWMFRDGMVWDEANARYVFDSVESTWYGVRDILGAAASASPSGSVVNVSAAVRLLQVTRCLAKIDRWLSVASLAEDIERGFNWSGIN
jgi:hypothetical protein